jgi:hypothetical protein
MKCSVELTVAGTVQAMPNHLSRRIRDRIRN